MKNEARLQVMYPSIYEALGKHEEQVQETAIDAAFSDDTKNVDRNYEEREKSRDSLCAVLLDTLKKQGAKPEGSFVEPDPLAYSDFLDRLRAYAKSSEFSWKTEATEGIAVLRVPFVGDGTEQRYISVCCYFGIVEDDGGDFREHTLQSSWFPDFRPGKMPDVSSGMSDLMSALWARHGEEAPDAEEMFSDLTKILPLYVPTAADVWDAMLYAHEEIPSIVRRGFPFPQTCTAEVIAWVRGSEDDGAERFAWAASPTATDIDRLLVETQRVLRSRLLRQACD